MGHGAIAGCMGMHNHVYAAEAESFLGHHGIHNRKVNETPIRLINFDYFKRSKTGFPRFPQDKRIVTTLERIDRQKSLIVYISHAWLRPEHPDNVQHEKFVLCVDGIGKIWRELAPGLPHCYVYMDYCCLNQDLACPASELKSLREVIKLSDCLFTPLVAEVRSAKSSRRFSFQNKDLYREGFLEHAWCRLELLLAAHLPITYPYNLFPDRHNQFKGTFKLKSEHGVRPQYLYSQQDVLNKHLPVVMPPVNYIALGDIDPRKGKILRSEDSVIIETIIDENLLPILSVHKVGWSGEYDGNKKCTGNGTYVFDNGNTYTGTMSKGKFHGKGVHRMANGSVYEGQFSSNMREGKGRLRTNYGDEYEGDFKGDEKHGWGVYAYAEGHVYRGNYTHDKKHGQGVYDYGGGVKYDGAWAENMMEGKGVFHYAANEHYTGDWHKDQRHGTGTMHYADGQIYQGEWHQGTATSCITNYPDGSIYEGELLDDRFHGKGKLTFANGLVMEGRWSKGVRIDEQPITVEDI